MNGDENEQAPQRSSLKKQPSRAKPSLKDEADADATRKDSKLREELGAYVQKVFTWLNIRVILIVAICAVFDTVFIYTKIIDPGQRLIGEKVILALITATAVQVGAGFIAIIGYLFPSSRNGGDSSGESSNSKSLTAGFGGVLLGLVVGMILWMNPINKAEAGKAPPSEFGKSSCQLNELPDITIIQEVGMNSRETGSDKKPSYAKKSTAKKTNHGDKCSDIDNLNR